MTAAARSIRPVRVLAFAAALGIAGGVGLSFHRQQQAEQEIARIAAAPTQLDPVRFPEARGPAPVSAPSLNPLSVDGIPAYPSAKASDLLAQPPGHGSELQAAWFVTPDPPDVVLGFYEGRFSDMQVPWITHRYSQHAGYVGFLEYKTGRLHLVSVMRQGDQTVVFPSTSYPARLLNATVQDLPDVPRHPRTRKSMVFDFDEKVLAKSSWFGLLERETVAEAVAWYRTALAEKGWTVGQAVVLPSGEGKLEASRTGAKASFTLRRDKQDVSVYVTLSG